MTEPRYRITLHGKTADGVTVMLLDTWVRAGGSKTVPVYAGLPPAEVGRLEVRYYHPDEVDQYVGDMQMAEALEAKLLDEMQLDAAMPPDPMPFDTGGEGSDG